jgi:hypothetical protein
LRVTAVIHPTDNHVLNHDLSTLLEAQNPTLKVFKVEHATQVAKHGPHALYDGSRLILDPESKPIDGSFLGIQETPRFFGLLGVVGNLPPVLQDGGKVAAVGVGALRFPLAARSAAPFAASLRIRSPVSSDKPKA